MNVPTTKPLVTMLIVFYNQEKYAADAVRGALSQDYENLEIILSDDGSKDNTFKVLQKAVKNYNGPHKVILNCNKPNLGISNHFNKLIYELSHGEYIVFAGGDDVSEPSRVSTSVRFLEDHPKVQSVTFQSVQCNERLEKQERTTNDNLSPDSYSIYSMSDYCTFKDFIIHSGDSRTVRRSVARFFGPLTNAHEEDLEFFVRSFLLGQVGIIYKPMVLRRNHGDNTCHKPKPRKLRDDQYNQMYKDTTLAYEKGIINDVQYKAMLTKIAEIRDHFCTIDNRARHMFAFRSINYIIKVLTKLRDNVTSR